MRVRVRIVGQYLQVEGKRQLCHLPADFAAPNQTKRASSQLDAQAAFPSPCLILGPKMG